MSEYSKYIRTFHEISEEFEFAYSYEVIINIMKNLQNYPNILMK